MIKGFLPLFTGSLYLFGLGADYGQAQIRNDLTVDTQVTSADQSNFVIDGGQQSGSNLFHSFTTFSVPSNGSARFNNGSNITNIISRITGPAASNIDGVIQAGHDANLFLINPNGIFFGPNARLGLGGSFLASTANQLLFETGRTFSATQPTSLLTVSAPIGLGFGSTAAPIRNQSRAFGRLGRPRIQPNGIGTTVGLQVRGGETLALVGGNIDLEGGVLRAPSGRLELASVGPGSRVNLETIGNNLGLEVPVGTELGNIALSPRNQQRSLASTSGPEPGSIQIQGQQLTLLNSNISASLNNFATGINQGGNINIQVPGRVVLSGLSEIATRIRTTGTAGTVFLETGQLILSNGGTVTSSTVTPVERESSNIGNAGTVIINATDLVRIRGRTSDGAGRSAIFSQSPGNVSGDAGRVTITTRRLVVEEGGAVSVGAITETDSNSPGTSDGNGGNLSVTATDSILVSGFGIDETGDSQPSALIAEAQGRGSSGNLRLETGQLLVQDQGTITVSSSMQGTAGNINITADSIHLENGGQLNAEATADGGGNITLRAEDNLLLRRGSSISTSSGLRNTAGSGGNIRITAPLVFAVPDENSDIRTDAFTGNGGAITISTSGLFGLSFRPAATEFSDITANSRFGLDGSVQINTPEIDPSKDTVNLPEAIRTAVLTQGCQIGEQSGQFIDTRRGGQPLSPKEIGNPTIWDDLRTSTANGKERSISRLKTPPSSAHPVQEAQGWVRDNQGKLVLLAQVPSVVPNALIQAAAPCRSF